MYNSDLPTRAELPTSAQLVRSTLIAGVSACAILVTVVLPAEYAIDPTGAGRVLGLTRMGDIKQQLAAEAAADTGAAAAAAPASSTNLATATAGSAQAAPMPATGRSDEVSLTLAPGQGAEIKLVMVKGAQATFSWTANGAVVNFDRHGEGPVEFISYEKGRSTAGNEGVLEAAFTGDHGWFWRNRTSENVTVTLRTKGDYSEVKRML